MTNIHDICDYVILKATSDEIIPMNNLKLQKLLYYIQAWHITFFDSPLFVGKFQAWVHGPVNREIYKRFRSSKYLYSNIGPLDINDKDCILRIDPEKQNFIDNVLEVYLKYSGTQLEAITHNEDPWILARHGYSPFASCEEEIKEDVMKAFYSSKLK